jgi:hypothetical protein
VLTTGLLIGSAGGAIAAADTESTGSTTSAEPSSETVETAAAPTATVTETPGQPTRPTPLRDLIRKLQALGTPRSRPVVSESKTESVAAYANESVAADANDESQEPGVTPAVTDPAADGNVVATDSNVTASETNAASNSNAAASSTDVVAPALKAVQPVTKAVATVAGAALSTPGVMLSLPASEAPVADVIAYVQNTLITVYDAVAPLAQVPGDLYSLLVVAGITTAVNPAGTSSAAGLAAAAGAALVPPTAPLPPPILPISPGGGIPLLGDVTASATLGGIATAGLSVDLSLSGTAPLAAEGAGPTSAPAFLEHAIRAVLAPASLSALAAFALPGVGGLLIICAAGMRIGYRQAKAALAVRSTGIARFARQGPLGIVRSGSLVALHSRHPRPLRVVRPEVSRAAPLLEQAA